jgi:hypothetical protein
MEKVVLEELTVLLLEAVRMVAVVVVMFLDVEQFVLFGLVILVVFHQLVRGTYEPLY